MNEIHLTFIYSRVFQFLRCLLPRQSFVVQNKHRNNQHRYYLDEDAEWGLVLFARPAW